MVTKINLRYH